MFHGLCVGRWVRLRKGCKDGSMARCRCRHRMWFSYVCMSARANMLRRQRMRHHPAGNCRAASRGRHVITAACVLARRYAYEEMVNVIIATACRPCMCTCSRAPSSRRCSLGSTDCHSVYLCVSVCASVGSTHALRAACAGSKHRAAPDASCAIAASYLPARQRAPARAASGVAIAARAMAPLCAMPRR